MQHEQTKKVQAAHVAGCLGLKGLPSVEPRMLVVFL